MIAVAAASSPYPAPAYQPAAYKAGPVYEEARRPHDFAYEVKDDASYVNMGQKESSDGKGVSGSYHVALPDGRMQVVNYKDDGYGLVADVSAPEGSGYVAKSAYPAKY